MSTKQAAPGTYLLPITCRRRRRPGPTMLRRLVGPAASAWARMGHGHRLALLVVTSLAPLIALLAAGAVQEHRHEIAAVRTHVADLSRRGAEQADDAMQEAANLLRVLTRVPDVAGMDGERCNAVLREVVNEHPRVGSLSAIAADGTIACSGRLVSIGISVADRSWFQDAMKPRAARVAFSDMLLSRTTRRPALVAVAPLPSPSADAAAPGVVAASMETQWFTQLGSVMADSRHSVVQVLDARQGRLIAQLPDVGLAGEAPLGDKARPLLAAVRAQPGGGTVEMAGFDGIERIYGFTPLPSGQESEAILLVGIARDVALQGAEERVAMSLLLGFAATGTALLLAWLLARASVTRPLQALAAGAARLGAGNLDARIGSVHGGGPEFATLASTLDRMAEELQARERAVADAQMATLDSERRFRLLAENSSELISLLGPDLRRVYVSPASREILGYAPDELTGLTVLDLVAPEDRAALAAEVEAGERRGDVVLCNTFRSRRKDGRLVWLRATARRLPDGTGWVSAITDVTGLKQAELRLEEANRKLRVAARQDALTGLPNRRAFDEMMGREYRRARRARGPLSVMLLDVDHFKAFNDRYGHPAGDACLRAVGHAIRGALHRPGDFAARYGGEEFVVLLPGTPRAGAVHIAGLVLDAVRALRAEHGGSPFGHVTASIGVATCLPASGKDFPGPAALVEAADAALYAAKRDGRNRVCPAQEPGFDPCSIPGLLPQPTDLTPALPVV